MPPNTVYVGRPTKWGNPFILKGGYPVKASQDGISYPVATRQEAVREYEEYLAWRPWLVKQIITELAGKNLACWCKPDQPCHADLLLAIANKKIYRVNLYK